MRALERVPIPRGSLWACDAHRLQRTRDAGAFDARGEAAVRSRQLFPRDRKARSASARRAPRGLGPVDGDQLPRPVQADPGPLRVAAPSVENAVPGATANDAIARGARRRRGSQGRRTRLQVREFRGRRRRRCRRELYMSLKEWFRDTESGLPQAVHSELIRRAALRSSGSFLVRRSLALILTLFSLAVFAVGCGDAPPAADPATRLSLIHI